jgi:hypothetical protein
MRAAQGLYEGSIERSAFEAAFAPMVDASQNTSFDLNGEQLRFLIFREPASVTDEELKEVIESLRTLADDAGVSATPEMIDLSDALQAEIDASLAGETPALPEAQETEEPATDAETEGEETPAP